eukprot:2356004-Alexandrium_andersonii.AAC.1
MISRRVFIPVGLASHYASVARKLHCLFHQIYMEPGSPTATCAFGTTVTATTTDYGTDVNLVGLPVCRFNDFFPYFCDLGSIADAGVQVEAVEAGPVLNLRRALAVPGGMHIISNATKT